MSVVSLRKAGGSVMVTVPPAYLKKHELGPGDTVEAEIHGDKLTIRPRRNRLTLSQIIESAPKEAASLRAEGWDEMPAVGNEQ